MRSLICILLFLFPISALSQQTGGEDSKEDDDTRSGVRLVVKDRPSLRIGKAVRIELESKLQFDFINYVPDLKVAPKTDDPYELGRARFGIVGRVTKYVEYELEREFRGSFGETRPAYPWKDAYVDFKISRFAGVKAGKFKVPFGLEQNTSASKLDFIHRSRASDFLTSGRDKGVMVYGKLLKGDRLDYAVGSFQSDGEVAVAGGIKTADQAWAARITGEPLRLIPRLPKTIQKVHLGMAAVTTQAFEGISGLRGQTAAGETFFPHIQINGNRLRLGAEFSWQEGPLSLKSEFINVSQERRMQSIRLADLSDMFARGWYASAGWTALGTMKSNGTEPKKPFLSGGGFGAVELAARFEALRFDSTEQVTRESRSPRASNILGNSDRSWTVGATWFVDRFVKFQINGIRETIEDIQRSPIGGRAKYWTVLARIQVAM